MVSAPVENPPAPASAADSTSTSDEHVNQTQQVNPAEGQAAPGESGAPAQETKEQQAPVIPAPEQAREPSYDFADLQRRHDAVARGDEAAEPLTTQERQALGRHQQSEADASRARQQAQQQYQQNQARIRELTSGLPGKLEETYIKRFGLDPDNPNHAPHIELARREIAEALGTTFGEIEPIVLQPWEAAVDGAILSFGSNSAESVRTVESLRGKSFDSHIQALTQAAYDLGTRSSPDGKKVTDLQGKLESANAEIERLKGNALAKAGTASTTGTAVAPANFSSETDLNRAYNKGDVDRSTYATEYKRLTGREP